MASLDQMSIVLHRPRSLDNVGAVARLVKNFGLGRLWLVDPHSYSFDRAHKLAVGAEEVVDQVFVERDLPTALGAFTYSVGTSSRELRGRRSLHPSEVAERLAAQGGTCALVFGEEKRGLSDDELACCQEVCRIPSAAAQPSLNLAQACAVLAYAVAGAPAPPAPRAPAASQAQLWALRARLGEALVPADFVNPQAPERILAELLRPLERAQLTPRELELWSNALRKVALALARGGERRGP